MTKTLDNQMKTPIYILEEERLRANLSLITSVAERTGVEVIFAFKAVAMWKTFNIFREYTRYATASSLNEARLAVEEWGEKAHTYAPVYADEEIEAIARLSSHLTFNSLNQYHRHAAAARAANPGISFGLRINPEYSEVTPPIYNPCMPGSRFGITSDLMPERLPKDVEGLHCHCHCESSAEAFQHTLAHIEKRFARWFPQIKWINFGGGHLMTSKGYNVELLVETLRGFRERYPYLKVIIEPGQAFVWETGDLHTKVMDIVNNHGVKTAILDVSFTCHAPDCLEMPYQPDVDGAEKVALERADEPRCYRFGGNSCLAGDYLGSWRFDHDLQIGEPIVLKDMIHYSIVKTTMFNGIRHPSLGLLHRDGTLETLREFTYEDYKNRMD